MSSNNRLIVIKNKKAKNQFEVHMNYCVDNEFIPSKTTFIKRFKTLQGALKFSNDYCNKEMVEYGTYISNECLK